MKRIDLLDLWRGVCLALMAPYHVLWDLAALGVTEGALLSGWWAHVYRYAVAGGFILLSGVCAPLSRDPVRRGFITFCAGAAVTAATSLAGYPVAFGALHLLGCCMLLYGALRPRLRRADRPWLPVLWLLLFAGSWLLTARVRVPVPWLYPLGLRAPGFYSADYYPLLPWGFLFLAGTVPGERIRRRPDALPLHLQKRLPPALTFPGRHSLLIYLLHQPLLYGALWLLFRRRCG